MAEIDESMTALVHEQMPFTRQLGLEIVSATAERVVARVSWSPDRCTSADALHGGYLMSVADSLGGVVAFLNLPDGATGTSTIESKTNFLRGATSGDVVAVAEPIHVGRTTIVVQTDLLREDGKIVTRTTQTQIVLGD